MPEASRGANLSTDLDDPEAVPYFLWDEPMTVAFILRQWRELGLLDA